MSDQTSFEVSLYSPRWGHDDIYTIKLERTLLTFSNGNSALCSMDESGNLKWTGYRQGIGNPLVEILENDSIYPPSVFVSGIEYAWMDWKNGILNDQNVQEEVQHLCEWVNTVSKSKPQSKFWLSKF